MLTKIGVKTQELTETANLLCRILADEFVLYVKTLNAHWNIEGSDFYNKHLFFEALYQEMISIIDQVAERIRAVGHYAPATLSAFAGLTHLTEEIQQDNNSTTLIEALLEDHTVIINLLRQHVNAQDGKQSDIGSIDFMTTLVGKHEQMAWKLRSHLPS